MRAKAMTAARNIRRSQTLLILCATGPKEYLLAGRGGRGTMRGGGAETADSTSRGATEPLPLIVGELARQHTARAIILATAVGVLDEVPVMLSVCAACNRSRRWFDVAAG